VSTGLLNAILQQGALEEPLSKKTFDHIVKSVLGSSEYIGYATLHAIRHFWGEKVSGKPFGKVLRGGIWSRRRANDIERISDEVEIEAVEKCAAAPNAG
jgi:hypothetical protein